jgi:hypothetical protein
MSRQMSVLLSTIVKKTGNDMALESLNSGTIPLPKDPVQREKQIQGAVRGLSRPPKTIW